MTGALYYSVALCGRSMSRMPEIPEILCCATGGNGVDASDSGDFVFFCFVSFFYCCRCCCRLDVAPTHFLFFEKKNERSQHRCSSCSFSIFVEFFCWSRFVDTSFRVLSSSYWSNSVEIDVYRDGHPC